MLELGHFDKTVSGIDHTIYVQPHICLFACKQQIKQTQVASCLHKCRQPCHHDSLKPEIVLEQKIHLIFFNNSSSFTACHHLAGPTLLLGWSNTTLGLAQHLLWAGPTPPLWQGCCDKLGVARRAAMIHLNQRLC